MNTPPPSPLDLSLQLKQHSALTVDDNPTLLKALSRGLRSRFREVYQASDITSALPIIKEQLRWKDLIVSDYNMPGGSGVELAEIIREIKRERELIFVILSGGMDGQKTGKIHQAINNGLVDAYLLKPAGIAEIMTLLGKHQPF